MSARREVIVRTASGELEGVFEKGLYAFKGVPYAAPPVGDLRWMPPQPAAGWRGAKPAREYGPIAPQTVFQAPGFVEEPEPQSEDCLFLNVYSPGLDGARRPVMVWIHGGAFCMGSGSMQAYRESTLPRSGDVVLVTFNYRLGFLGFLNLEEATGGRIPSTGNEGLLDQVAALRWVRENIAGFGGDPGNVTVFGESAGGMSIGCLLAMPEARGLFHRAIIESAVGEMARTRDASLGITEEFFRAAAVGDGDVAALRRLPLEQLLRAQRLVAARTGQGAAPAIPAADGAVMPRMPLDALESGLGMRIPTLVGSNCEEDRFFSMMNPRLFQIGERELRDTAARYVAAEDVEHLLEAYRTARAARGEPTGPFEIFTALNTDVLFRTTALRIAGAQCRHAPGGWNYLFGWKSPAAQGLLGACHALEVGFVFGRYDDSFCGTGPEADGLSRAMQDAWTSFARTGDPGCPSLGPWPRYSENRATMIFDRASRLEQAAYDPERRIWDSVKTLKYSNMP